MQIPLLILLNEICDQVGKNQAYLHKLHMFRKSSFLILCLL